MHRFILLIVATLLLASCGGAVSAPATTTATPIAQASVQPTTEPSPSAIAEPTSEPTSEPSSSPATESTVAASPETGTAPDIDPAVAVYATDILSPLSDIGEGLTGFGTLVQNPQLTDDAWKAKVVVEIAKIRQGHENLTKLNPPAAAAPAHNQLISATSDCNEAANKITSGLDTDNIAEIGEASTLIISCGTKLQKAQAMLLELAPQ